MKKLFALMALFGAFALATPSFAQDKAADTTKVEAKADAKPAADAAKAAEPKAEEAAKAPEPEPEEEEAGGFSLFD